MKKKSYWVYLLANHSKTIYIGVTNDLLRRVYEHKNRIDPNSFTSKYNIHKLVYFEETDDVSIAIH